MESSDLYIRTVGGKVCSLAPYCVMGIVNLTPDSFFDGGTHNTANAAVNHAERLFNEGAGILDFGAESTRPGAEPVDSDTECARLLPVLTATRAKCPNAVISVDTRNSVTAARVLESGNAHIINDVSACMYDPALLDILAQFRPGYVLMHSQGTPEIMQNNPHYKNIVEEVLSFFESQMHRLTRAGLSEDNIIIDPGIGFGKTAGHNVELIAAAPRLQKETGRPLLMGLSMKSLFGHLLGLPVEKRGLATQVASALSASQGIVVHRVHDVAATVQTLRLVEKLAFSKNLSKE